LNCIERKVVLGSVHFQPGVNEACALALKYCILCYIESDMYEIKEERKSPNNGIFEFFGLRIKRLLRRPCDLVHKYLLSHNHIAILTYSPKQIVAIL